MLVQYKYLLFNFLNPFAFSLKVGNLMLKETTFNLKVSQNKFVFRINFYIEIGYRRNYVMKWTRGK